ncbi:MAG: TonB-linked SusC/RagA family outer membrane protein, partial [Saprospiraceae bacterium]
MKSNLQYSLTTVGLFLLVHFSAFAQSTYTGIVKDASDSEPLIGVTVLVTGTNRGAVTGLDGSYSIKAKPDDVLQFSYAGYSIYDLLLTTQTANDVALLTDTKLLDEIVVVGYGTVKKSDLTGSVSTVKSEELIKVPSSNAMNALQGKVSGLQILNTSGDPGAVPVVRLRGVTTLNNNNPIAVIDGVITQIESVSLLNPNDIASMVVLKDASAIAIYGSRGAAGVVIVTTKKGVSGKNRVSASIERSYETVANRIGVMDGREFATYLNVIEPGAYNNLDVLPNTDWQDLIFKDNTPITSVNFSVGGGSEKATYYFGLGYFNQEGVLPKSGLERFTGKLNTAFNLAETVKIGLDLSFSRSDKDNAPGVINTALTAWPINKPFLADGETFAEVIGGNPLAAIEYSNSNTTNLRGLGNLYASIDFLKNFTFKTSLQFDLSDAKNRNFTPQFFVGPLQQNDINNLSYGQVSNSTMIYEQTLSYNRDFDKHTVNAVVGYTAQDSRFEFINGSTEGLLRESELFRYLDAGQDEFENVSNNFGRSTLISYLGRVNYS